MSIPTRRDWRFVQFGVGFSIQMKFIALVGRHKRSGSLFFLKKKMRLETRNRLPSNRVEVSPTVYILGRD